MRKKKAFWIEHIDDGEDKIYVKTDLLGVVLFGAACFTLGAWLW